MSEFLGVTGGVGWEGVGGGGSGGCRWKWVGRG